MFSVEIRINGNLIGHIYGQNVTPSLIAGGKGDEYSYEYYEPTLGALVKGLAIHIRERGIRPLIATILADVDKRLKTRGLPKGRKVEATSLSLPRWRTPTGEPTCSAKFPDEMCPLLRTARMGSLDLCALSTGKEKEVALNRRDTAGFLIPGPDCVVWNEAERKACTAITRPKSRRKT